MAAEAAFCSPTSETPRTDGCACVGSKTPELRKQNQTRVASSAPHTTPRDEAAIVRMADGLREDIRAVACCDAAT